MSFDWKAIQLAFQFVPKLPIIEKGAAVLRDDEDFSDLVKQLPKLHDLVTRLSADDDVKAAFAVLKDLFRALAIDGGSKKKLAHELVKHGADEQEVKKVFSEDHSKIPASQEQSSGNPDASNAGSDNANI